MMGCTDKSVGAPIKSIPVSLFFSAPKFEFFPMLTPVPKLGEKATEKAEKSP